MVGSVESYTGPTYISYHGHGQIERAATNSSLIHVDAHERRHITSYYRKALALGAEVKNPRIHYDVEFRDGKLVAVGGKATALIISPPDDVQISEPGRDAAKTLIENAPVDKAQEPPSQTSSEELVRELQSIQRELKADQEQLEYQKSLENSEADKSLADRKKRDLDQKLDEVNRLLAQMRSEQAAETSAELLAAGAETYDVANRIATIARGTRPKQQSPTRPNLSPAALRIRFSTVA